MQIIDFLDKSKAKYEVTKHEPTYTAQNLAAAEHEPGKFVAKPVIVEADDHLAFQAGSYEKAVRMSMDDYRKLVDPKVLEFSY